MSEEKNQTGVDSSRRKFIKKMAYIPPVVMTLHAVPSHANTGSPRQHKDYDKKHKKEDKYKKEVKYKFDKKKKW